MPLTRILSGAITDANVTTPKIADGNVTTAKLPDAAIITSKIADANVTSPKLASNLSISLTRVAEEANMSPSIFPLGIRGNVNIDILNNTVYFFASNTSGNVTFNLRGSSDRTFDSAVNIGEAVTVSITVKHGLERHSANLYIDGGRIPYVGQDPDATVSILTTSAFSTNTIVFAANTKPPRYASLSLANSEINMFTYTVFKHAANQYTILAANTLFGVG